MKDSGLAKLLMYGVKGDVLNLYVSYYSRSQSTRIECLERLNWSSFSCQVFQESCLELIVLA